MSHDPRPITIWPPPLLTSRTGKSLIREGMRSLRKSFLGMLQSEDKQDFLPFSRRAKPISLSLSPCLDQTLPSKSNPSSLAALPSIHPQRSPNSYPENLHDCRSGLTTDSDLRNDLVERIRKCIRSLQNDYDRIVQLEKCSSQQCIQEDDQGKECSPRPLILEDDEIELCESKSCIYDCISKLEMVAACSHQRQIPSDPSSVTASTHARFCPYKDIQSNNEKMGKGKEIVELGNKERYVCVSDGFTIWCLDMKQTQDFASDYCNAVEKAPSVISLKLQGEGGVWADSHQPCSFVLSNLDSHAYLVGGGFFGGGNDVNPPSLASSSNMEFVDSLGEQGESPSWNISRLTLEHGVLHLSPCDGIVSHEVLKGNDPSGCDWIQISGKPKCSSGELHMKSHFVVGHRLYANNSNIEYGVFDWESKEWETHKFPVFHNDLVFIKHVAEIFLLGFGRCIGEFRYGNSQVEPLYVFLGIADNLKSGTHAVAFLVNKWGQVVCFQRLNRFFEGFMEPIFSHQGIVIVSHGKENDNSGCVVGQERSMGPLFMITFSWEPVDNADEVALDVLQNYYAKTVEEEDFLHLVVKDWYRCEESFQLFSDVDNEIPTCLTACFL